MAALSLKDIRDPFRMDLPAEFGIFLNWGGRGGLVDLDSKFFAAEKKNQTKRGGGRGRGKNIKFQTIS